ncbi:hypothetical protein B0H16DRAFT_1817130 [Mycena metata]|uniref:Uncharacterized protein n=1 Tax=Mycena metata TaxID=1033252 RepID=A0AAD7NY90_9AGAR|nr:hypothetical protein B0H16DRAFT_1817130 [Mycena metata]
MPIPEHVLASALLRLANMEADGVPLPSELTNLLDHADDAPQRPPQRRARAAAPATSSIHLSSPTRAPTPAHVVPSPVVNSSTPSPLVPLAPRLAYRPRHRSESQRRARSLPLEGLPLSDEIARIANFDAVPFLRPVLPQLPTPSPASSTQLSSLMSMQTPTPSTPSTPSSTQLSTPTTMVNPTPPPKLFQILPPLQLPITTDVDIREPQSPLDSRPSSPSSPFNSRPSSPSPASTSLGKRVTSDRAYSNEEGETEQEEEERENEQQQQKRPRVTLKLGNGGSGGGGGGGGPPAHLWTDECVRNGDRRRAGDDATIGAMPCQEGTCTSCDAQQQQVAGGDTSGASSSAAAGSSGNASRAAMDVDGEVDADADENRRRSTRASAGRKKAGSAVKKAGTGATKKNTKKKGITEKGWCEDPNGGPPLTKTAGNFFCALLAVWNSQGRTDLETVLAGPEHSSSLPGDDPSASSPRDDSDSHRLPAPSPDYDPANTDASYTRVLQLINKSKFLDLQIIMALIQLALNVDSEIHQAALKGKTLSKEAIGRRINKKNPTSGNNFRQHVGWGYRFAFLAAGGTLGIIPIIAALELRTVVTRQMHAVDIDCVGTALREACHGKWLPLVKQLMLPIAYIRNRPGYMQTLKLSYKPPVPPGESPKQIVVFGLNDYEVSDKIFDALQTNTIILQHRKIPPQYEDREYSFNGFPGRSSQWDSAPGTLPWKPMPDAGDIHVPTPVTVTSPVKLGAVASKMPFKKKDRDTWTENQRGRADKALKVTSVDQLQEKINTVHEGGKAAGNYIEVNTGILDKQALFIRDKDGQLIALLFSVPDEFKESL